jgi:hypothetical protein
MTTSHVIIRIEHEGDLDPSLLADALDLGLGTSDWVPDARIERLALLPQIDEAIHDREVWIESIRAAKAGEAHDNAQIDAASSVTFRSGLGVNLLAMIEALENGAIPS